MNAEQSPTPAQNLGYSDSWNDQLLATLLTFDFRLENNWYHKESFALLQNSSRYRMKNGCAFIGRSRKHIPTTSRSDRILLNWGFDGRSMTHLPNWQLNWLLHLGQSLKSHKILDQQSCMLPILPQCSSRRWLNLITWATGLKGTPEVVGRFDKHQLLIFIISFSCIAMGPRLLLMSTEAKSDPRRYLDEASELWHECSFFPQWLRGWMLVHSSVAVHIQAIEISNSILELWSQRKYACVRLYSIFVVLQNSDCVDKWPGI